MWYPFGTSSRAEVTHAPCQATSQCPVCCPSQCHASHICSSHTIQHGTMVECISSVGAHKPCTRPCTMPVKAPPPAVPQCHAIPTLMQSLPCFGCCPCRQRLPQPNCRCSVRSPCTLPVTVLTGLYVERPGHKPLPSVLPIPASCSAHAYSVPACSTAVCRQYLPQPNSRGNVPECGGECRAGRQL